MKSKLWELIVAALVSGSFFSGITVYLLQRYVPPNTGTPNVYIQGPYKDPITDKSFSIVTLRNEGRLMATNVVVRIRYENTGLWGIFDYSYKTSGDEPDSVLRRDNELFVKLNRIVPDAYVNIVIFQKYPTLDLRDIDVSTDGGLLSPTSFFAWPQKQ